MELFDWLRRESPSTKVIAVSSAAVYGAGHVAAISETAELRPHSPYGYHKLMMEMICRSYGASFGLQSAVARLFSVYGRGLKKQLLWDLCTKLATATRAVELDGSGDELRDWTDVRDVTKALAELPRWAASSVPTLNIATGIGTRVRDIAEGIIASWSAVDQVELRFSGKARPGDPFSLLADSSQANSKGMACLTTVADGLADYVAWFRSLRERPR
jgi:UDP-glucose 4-epimerase